MSHRPAFLLIATACLLLAGCAWTLKPTRDGDPRTGSVEGVVVDARHTGVPGAKVTVLTADARPEPLGSATTDAGGNFTVERVPPGDDRVVRAVKLTPRLGFVGRKENTPVHGGRTTDVGEIELKVAPN